MLKHHAKTLTTQQRQALIKLCRALINNETDFLEGCREIASFRWHLDEKETEDFLLFVGISSETDHYPSPESRHLYSDSFLDREDKAINELIAEIKSDVIDACDVLIDKYQDDH